MMNTVKANTVYLLTGAAGFLGSNICRQLIERGDSVRAFVLNNDPAVKYIPEGVEIFEGNLCSPKDCMKFFDVEEGAETICIHCASILGMDTFALGLIKAAELIEDGRIDAFIEEKYSSWNSELGQKIRRHETTLEELAAHAAELGNSKLPGSSRQEYLESIFNNVLFK